MRNILPTFLSLLLSFLPLKIINGQTNTTFEKGEIQLDNSQVISGYIWIVDNPSGLKKVYYKPDLTAVASDYSALDLVSIKLNLGKRLIVSEAVPSPEGTIRKLVEVHFKGNITLVSQTGSKQKTYYIIDNEGNVFELVNTYNIPGQAGRYDLSYNYEYKQLLGSVMFDKSKFTDLLNSTDFNDKSISHLLKKYHQANNFEYNIYPPPPFSGFIGGGASVIFMKHQSDLNQGFVSTSPFAGFSFIAGLKTAGGRTEISYEPAFMYGIIYHDNHIDVEPNTIIYYEDIAKTSILTNSINITAIPFNYGKFSPSIGIGLSYNNYLSYSREVTEEIYYEDSGIVFNYFNNDFERPEPYFGASAKAGINYHLINRNSIRLSYIFNKYFGDNAGPKEVHAATISFIHHIY